MMHPNGSDYSARQDTYGNSSELLSSVNSSNHHSAVLYRDSLFVIVPVTFVYACIFITGIVGNVSTCIVIFSNKYMHTATNFYLFSLALSDLLLLFTALPKEVYELWFRYTYVFGEVTCILQGFASETAVNATILTITAFTVERYVAICHPFMSHTVSKLSRALKHIIIIWLSALCLAIPQAIQFGIIYTAYGMECTVKSTVMDHAFEMSSLLFFVIPMVVISVLYVRIGFRLRSPHMVKLGTPGNSGMAERKQTIKNQSRVIRMLVAVVVAFIICWAPFHAQRLVSIYGRRGGEEAPGVVFMQMYSVLTYISGILYYLSATINPVLYNIMSHRFRRAFKFTFGHLCNCCLSKQKRSKYMIKSRSGYASRLNNHFQAWTPRSSTSQKEEVQLVDQKLPYAPLLKKNSCNFELHQSNGSLPANPKNRSTLSSPGHQNGNAVNGVGNVRAAVDEASDGVVDSHYLSAAPTSQSGKVLKKERSPIIVLKNKLNALRALPSRTKKQSRQHFYSMEDLSEVRCTELESLHHSEYQLE